MNTDVRRAVFIAVMGSDDCMEAFEKLTHLPIKVRQEAGVPKDRGCSGAVQAAGVVPKRCRRMTGAELAPAARVHQPEPHGLAAGLFQLVHRGPASNYGAQAKYSTTKGYKKNKKGTKGLALANTAKQVRTQGVT